MNTLRIHYLQHVPFEDLGCIEEWVLKNDHTISSTKFYERVRFPDQSMFDWIIILGGPMGVNDTEQYQWLDMEKEFIRNSIENNKIVLGICLGAQLIAAALGARVYPNKHKEIGWFPIIPKPFLSNPLQLRESIFTVFHWHAQTFDLPEGAIHLASSSGCLNQAFCYNEKVIALQFHFEVTEKSLHEMLTFGKHELINAQYVQSYELIEEGFLHIQQNNQRMYLLLDYLATK